MLLISAALVAPSFEHLVRSQICPWSAPQCWCVCVCFLCVSCLSLFLCVFLLVYVHWSWLDVWNEWWEVMRKKLGHTTLLVKAAISIFNRAYKHFSFIPFAFSWSYNFSRAPLQERLDKTWMFKPGVVRQARRGLLFNFQASNKCSSTCNRLSPRCSCYH